MTAGKYISTLLIVLSLSVVVLSFNIEEQNVFDPSSPSFFPALVGVVMLICALVIARGGIQSPSSAQEEAKKQVPVKGNDEDEPEKEMYEKENITEKGIRIRLILFTALVVIFAILMNYINFLFLSFLYLFGAMLLLSREKMLRSFIISLILSVGFYYTFVHVFHIVFP